MTGFFWAGCHQFQIEPEVLIKPSLAGFFFILTAEFQTQAMLLLTNLSTFFRGAESYHPVAGGCSGQGDPARELLLSASAPAGCVQREHREGSRRAQPVQMHIEFTRSP